MKKSFLPIVSFVGLLFGLLASAPLQAQQEDAAVRLALDHLKTHCADYGLSAADVAEPWVSSAYSSKKSGVTHVYFNQMYQGVKVWQATGNANIDREGKLINLHARFVPNLAGLIANTAPTLTADKAVRSLASNLGVDLPATLEVAKLEGGAMQKISFVPGEYALEPIEVGLAYYLDEALGMRLAWEVEYYEHSAEHYWVAFVDAATGYLLNKYDKVVHCEFGSPETAARSEHVHHAPRSFSSHLTTTATTTAIAGPQYNVFPMPVESPNHGDRELLDDPANPVASPFGWHDFDGEAGADETITFGNNVHAYADLGNDNSSAGDEPDGGVDLHFDFPLDLAADPSEYQDAAVTNLFYWCNIMHDVWYQYGFDEPAGNFQINNYGNGGAEFDHVLAEAQDGGGTNNANFATPDDGASGRMQMYLWFGGGEPEDLLTIDSPMGIAGTYGAVEAGFGPGLPTDVPITGSLVLADDGTATPTLGCEFYLNAADVSGNIALIDRGDCTFVVKVQTAQDAGAVAAIICNNNENPPFAMGGNSGAINIPSIMISQADCELIKTELANGVTGSLLGTGISNPPRDGDFDSGIVCHEYGHGVSNRLTGGPDDTGCLFNAEQMGEGWSDYVGLMLTMEEGDLSTDIRGVGTFALDQATDGIGIRPAPYSTDFGINPFTYAATNDVNNISQPHGVGFVWCSMLWDMTWLLIDEYGFDPDFYNGTGGNNIAMQLVTEGMKIQPCGPGFIDGRDAILEADMQLYGGANQCLIWEAFAKRGLGVSASQGSANSRTDQVEAFDLPTICLIPDFPPQAAFALAFGDECNGKFVFEDQSTDIPQMWMWDFGDGNSSTESNPTHIYDTEGTFDVTLIVTNTLGADTVMQQVTVDFIDSPLVEDGISCDGEPATLTAVDNGYTINWYENGDLVFSGNEFVTSPIAGPTTYMVQSEDKKPLQSAGPVDNTFGSGGYHISGFFGAIIFEAEVPFILESAWVNASGAGDRLFRLLDMNGNLINSVNVFLPDGPSTVTLNLEVPGPGMYQIGGSNVNLFRNDSGAQYPYELPGILTMTASTATTNAQAYYYYLYDWKVREPSCFSPQVPVEVTIEALPEVDFNFTETGPGPQVVFEDASTGAISWLWDFGDGNTSTEQNPVHAYAATGTYTVSLTISNGICENTLSHDIDVLNTATYEIEGLSEFNLSPSLGAGQFTLTVALERSADLDVRVVNALGQVVHRFERPQTSFLQEQVNLSGLASGLYFVQLNVGEQQAVERYVLVQ